MLSGHAPALAAPDVPHIPSYVSHIGSQSFRPVNQLSHMAMQISID
ncbi:protein of unknown function [Aminobacter niigataensis]|nr:protein of unknown function [Aminobacter niigataensis]